LVIQAHQQIVLEIFIRFRSDFLKTPPSPAISESPNVSQIHSVGDFCTIQRVMRYTPMSADHEAGVELGIC